MAASGPLADNARVKRTPRRADAESPPKRRGRKPIPAEQQRARLLEAARVALVRNEFGSVRVGDVVRAAGMSSRSFYDHFASKEDLLLELIREAGRRLLAELEAIFATSLSPVDRVPPAVGAYLAAFSGTPLDLEKLGESASQPVQRLLREIVREVGVLVARELEAAHRAGLMRQPIDPVELEVLLLGLLGIASSYVADGRREELASLQPRLVALLLRLWR
jgi:AcrR family transcriptional regulator